MMFSGIIQATAQVKENAGNRLIITRPESFTDIILGASIAVSGVCLTVASFDKETMAFDVVEETLNRTKLGTLKAGDLVNLERPLTPVDRMDGHTVQGHIEGVAVVTALHKGGSGTTLEVELPKDLIKFVVQKGSIAIDGVSLTVASVSGNKVTVALIPTTLQMTTLGSLSIGDSLNVETDVIGRYLYAFTHEEAAV